MSELIRAYVDRPLADVDGAVAAASIAARHWGLPQPVLMRRGMTAIFAAGDEVVLRVCLPTAPAEGALWLAGELATRGIRVPAAVRDDVVRHGALQVVALQRVHSIGAIDWSDVGEQVRRVHDIDPNVVAGRVPLPDAATFPWWQCRRLLDEVSDQLDASAAAGLAAAIARWDGWERSSALARHTVCHGDVHPGNVIQSSQGAVLLDWDLLCHAPPAWDHAPLMTWDSRWGGAGGTYPEFVRGYGESMRDEWLGEALGELRLVAATLMRVRAGATDADAATEAERRLAFWRGDVDAPQWNAM